MHYYEQILSTPRALPVRQIPPIQPNLLLVKNISISGVFWGALLIHEPRVLLDSVRTHDDDDDGNDFDLPEVLLDSVRRRATVGP